MASAICPRTSSSSSTSASRPWDYEVFLSFRGEDTRRNFTSHLYAALIRKGIVTFQDDGLSRGEDIASDLFKAIEKSRCALVILSENYADSRWCLEELAKIMKCRLEMRLLVFPIFYHVDPSDVKMQNGSYGKALANHEQNGFGHQTLSWRKALTEVGNLIESGWHIDHGCIDIKWSEARYIKKIVFSISRKLHLKDQNLTGMDDHFDEYVFSRPKRSSSDCPWTYDVFLSYRAQDTRMKIADHLYTRLIERGIRTFIDRDETLTSQAIERSRCALVLFSQNYANSSWCLEELAEIMECSRAKTEFLVFPIFYRVNPSHVRKQRGSYGDALEYHGRIRFGPNGPKIQRWRAALSEVANLSGWHLHDHQSEAEVIEDIIDTLLKRFSQKLLHVDKNLIGMGDRLKEIIPEMIYPLSNDVRMVGIYGFGGIGKTTISKVVYNQIASRFMISTFIANVREDSKSRGLLHLQKQLLHEIFPRKDNFITNVDEGIHMIQERLCFKKVLLVLDDVDSLDQLEALAGDRNWFGPESRIIVTTRDKHLLEVHRMDALYEAKKLDHKEAVELFSRHAFEQKHPKEEYETLSNSMVRYVDGLPLGLKVLGRFLVGKTICQWESELKKLEREPNQEIQSVLKRSYDELDFTQKEIFLDVACFFNTEDKDRVIRILDACNFYAESGMKVLSDKCLITIFDNTISMHDLLQQMGRDIVRNGSPKDPEKWSRLCYPEIVNRVLTRKLGTEAIEGILFDVSIPKRIHITTKSFEMMKKLRFLKIYWTHESASMGEDNKVKLSRDFEFPSYELRYLHWHGYPLDSLPSSFDAEDLIELDLCYSNLKLLWDSDLLLEKLNTIRVSFSQHLKELPDFAVSAPNLEKVILDGCSSLHKVHPSTGRLSKLILLSFKNCIKLCSFPSIINMEALAILNFSGCSRLKKFPDIQGNMEHLLELYLASTAIEELPSSIGHLTGLVLLDLKRCKNLKSLPTSICKLKSLQYLFLSGCSKLENFPEMIDDMKNLEELLLDGTPIEGLPPSIDHLQGLVLLNLRNCKNLVSLPEGMCKLASLETLIASGCSKLNNLPRNLGRLHRLVQLHADGTAITQPPESIVLLRNLQVLMYPGCKILSPTSLGSLFSFWLLPRNSSNGIGLCLPSSFSCFRYCTSVNLSNCKPIEGAIPNGICSLFSLKKLDLSRSNFLSIPAGISGLTNLKDLQLGQQENATEIPELPPSVQDMDAHNCAALLPIFSSIRTVQGLQFLLYNWSKPIEDESTDNKRNASQRFPHNDTSLVLTQKLLENIAFCIVFPGTGIPQWIWRQNEGSSVKIELPTTSDWYNDDFLGFALCSVVENLPEKIICHFNSDAFDYGDLKYYSLDFHWTGNNVNVGSEHVWLGYQPCSQLRLFQFNDPNAWYHIEISFEAIPRFKSCASKMVKKCGVCLIYAEDLEGMHPRNTNLLKSREHNVVKRSSDRAGLNPSGMYSSSISSSDGPTNNPTLKLKRKRPQE